MAPFFITAFLREIRQLLMSELKLYTIAIQTVR
jgi:hypothetical protein